VGAPQPTDTATKGTDMPNESLTEIAVILDRSGSMDSIKKDMEGGFATFIAEQRKIPDPCVVSLYRFDTLFDAVYEERALADVPALDLEPRGSTALLDAMGQAIGLIGARLAKKPESERPGKVVVMVITDGAENASREFNRQQIKEKVTHQQDVYQWQFAFLGANMDSIGEAQSLGIASASAGNFQANSVGVGAMYASSGKAIGNYRATRSRDAKLTLDKDEEKQT
jgi:hypothetical protein